MLYLYIIWTAWSASFCFVDLRRSHLSPQGTQMVHIKMLI